MSLRFLYSSGGLGGGGALAGFGVWVTVAGAAGACGACVCGNGDAVCAMPIDIVRNKGRTTLRTGDFTRSHILATNTLGAPQADSVSSFASSHPDLQTAIQPL